MTKTLFLTCGPYLEPLLLEELQSLGYSDVRVGYRGVYVDIQDFKAIYHLNYASRIAGRVLYPLMEFKCFNQKSLYGKASELDWLKYLNPNLTFAIDAHVKHPQFRNSLFAAQVLKDAICDQIRSKTGKRPSIDTYHPDVQLNLFLQNGKAIISFDTSGEPLHKRGYRLQQSEAPLQETLAAALLHLAKYKPEEIFCDPCCGSGTLLIEAAMMATDTPPGFFRTKWGFTKLPEFSSLEWVKCKNQLDSQRKELATGRIFGCDISKEAVRNCKIHLKAIGYENKISVVQSDFRQYKPLQPPTFFLTNPPYGSRLKTDADLVNLYRSLGDFFKQNGAKPSRAFILTGNLDLAKEIGLAAKRRHVLENGGIEARLLEYNLW